MLAKNRRKVILLGDSITQQSFSTIHQGWGASMADWYNRTADIINRGYSGYNSRWINQMKSKIIPQELTNSDIILTTLLLGANDSVNEESGQHISIDEYASNIQSIISYLFSLNSNMKIILITPPTVDHIQWPNRHIDQVMKYANVIREISQLYENVILLDLWNTNDNIEIIHTSDLRDGLHLNYEGNRKVFNNIQKLIRLHCNNISPDEYPDNFCNLTKHFPLFSELLDKSKEETQEILNNWKW